MADGKEIWALPEECTSIIISLTSPKDASILSAVSKSFKSAAESDLVWGQQFLPPDHQDILARSVNPVAYSSKKELYFHLCDSPLLLDGGKLSFKLSKPTGKKCYMLGARKLTVIWGDTPAYWQWKNVEDSRFAEVAELRGVYWLEVYGKMQTKKLSPNTNYTAYLVFKISENSWGLNLTSNACVHVFQSTTEVGHETEHKMVQNIVQDEENVSKVYLLRQGRGYNINSSDARMPEERGDGWMEIELGEYFVNEGNGDDHILMYLGETSRGNRKSGLIVEGIELRPKE